MGAYLASNVICRCGWMMLSCYGADDPAGSPSYMECRNPACDLFKEPLKICAVKLATDPAISAVPILSS